MKPEFKNYLFRKHILVCENAEECTPETVLASLSGLMEQFGIFIDKGSSMACMDMIRVAADNLGEYVPEAFYVGFPNSVRKLSKDQLMYDQMISYLVSYGLGCFDEPLHSTIEHRSETNWINFNEPIQSRMKRLFFDERIEEKHFIILSEEDAEKELKNYIREMLRSSRPLTIGDEELAVEAVKEFKNEAIPEDIPCKHTACVLLYRTRFWFNLDRFLSVEDTIKLLEYIQLKSYGSDRLNKLNLKNQDRKFLTQFLDRAFMRAAMKHYSLMDIRDCFEKRKIWCGLLHHIHYKPINDFAKTFVVAIRRGINYSSYSVFEELMEHGDYSHAASFLVEKKGTGALIRNMDYILSRCEKPEEVKEVLSCLR